MQASKLQPVIIGGLFFGVLSALPIISMGNCCCRFVGFTQHPNQGLLDSVLGR